MPAEESLRINLPPGTREKVSETFTGRVTATLWDGLQHKGYRGTVAVLDGSNMLHGKVAGIRSLITYHADTLPELRGEFIRAVDDYLADCAADGKEPDIPESKQAA